MTFSELFSDPAYEPYYLVGLWIFFVGLFGNLVAELFIKIVRFIKRCLKHKDADQQK